MSSEIPIVPRSPGLIGGKEPAGVLCPGCQNHRITLTIDELIYGAGVRCPQCGLWLGIDKANSRDAINSVQKIKEARDAVKRFEG